MRTTQTETTESAIWSRVLEPANSAVSAETARTLLELKFSEEDKERMHVLAAKAREGSLTPAEQEEIRNYERVGNRLAILHSKARLCLKKVSQTNGQTR